VFRALVVLQQKLTAFASNTVAQMVPKYNMEIFLVRPRAKPRRAPRRTPPARDPASCQRGAPVLCDGWAPALVSSPLGPPLDALHGAAPGGGVVGRRKGSCW